MNKQKTSIPTLNRNGMAANEDSEKANMLNQYFSECFSMAELPLANGDYCNIQTTGECPQDILCTEDEVFYMLNSLNTTKANGPDRISARMLKNTAPSITPSLTKLLNISIQSGTFPEAWKLSTVVPITKGNEYKSPSNYRPISLLSVTSKLLERHFHQLIADHLSDNHSLANTQWGFQPAKSTVSALLSTTYDWLEEMEAGRDICSVFLDLKKAFDTVPHQSLMEKLVRLNLNPFILQWLCSYLTNRQQKVVVGGEESGTIPVISGVPQGSVLGPLLFLIYIDGVTRIPLSEGSKLVLYADDMLLYRRISSPEDFNILQNDVDAVNNWVNANHLCFNTTKCKYMLITRKKRPLNTPAILINGIPLDMVDSYKYLGLLISSDLSWSHHIDSICSKARKILGLLYRRFSCDTEPHALLQLYLSLVRPHLEYGSQVWDPHLQKDINQLESVQKFGLRVCAKQWDLSYNELLSNFDVPTLNDRRLYLKLTTMYKIVHDLLVFPPVFVRRSTRAYVNSNIFIQPYAHTNSFLYSFVPHSISIWNSLPNSITNAHSFTSFKSQLNTHLYYSS